MKVRATLGFCLFLISANGTASSQQPDPCAAMPLINQHGSQIILIQKDLIAVTRSATGSDQFQYMSDILSTGSIFSAVLSEAATACRIYQTIRSPADRQGVLPYVLASLRHAENTSSNSVAAINHGLGYVQRAGLANEAAKLRDAIRSTGATLSQMK